MLVVVYYHARPAAFSFSFCMQLLTMYVFVQAAVDGGQVGEVVSTLEDRLGRLA